MMKKLICLLLCALLLWNMAGPARGTESGADAGTQTDSGDSGDSSGADDGGDSSDSGGTDENGNPVDGGETDENGNPVDGGETDENGNPIDVNDPIPLTAPSRIGWGRDYRFLLSYYRQQDPTRIKTDAYGNEYVDCPGMMYWSADDDNQRLYRVDLFRQDPENGNVLIETIKEWKVSKTGGFESNFRFLWAPRVSGDYYFTVRAIGDGTIYADSDTTQSNIWTYEAPENQLTQPSRPRWKGTSEAETAYIYPSTTDVETDADTGRTGVATIDGIYRMGYEAQWWFVASLTKEEEEEGVVRDDEDEEDDGDSDSDAGDTGDTGDTQDPTVPQEAGTILTFYPKHYEFQPSEKMLSDFGSGYYSVQVRALSWDITKAKPSLFSPLSMVRYIEADNADLTTIVERIDKNSDAVNRQLAINNVRKFGTYKLLELMSADKNNTGAVAAIEQLETMTGNYAQVEVSGGLDEIFPEGAISVIGAGLNVDLGQSVVFNLGQAQASEVPSTLYSHAVRFSMQLLDVNGASLTSGEDDLKVPVKITLPVPDTINPSFFVILHHRTDTTTDSNGETIPYVETIPHVSLQKVENQWYASFIVTHFSDFTMAEQAAFLEAKRVSGGVSVSYRMNAPGAETALCAVREKSGRLCAVRALTLSERQTSVTIPCDGAAANAQLFLLDGHSSPVIPSLTAPVASS